jgi:hypothetical protein
MREHSRMGFNRRKEDEHRRAAENKAAQQRATDPQIMEDAERLVALWNERQKQQMPMLFRRSSAPPSRPVLVSPGALPGVPDHQRHRFAQARSPPRRGDHESHSGTVMPLVPAERAVQPNWCGCRAKASPTKCGRNTSGGCLEGNNERVVSTGGQPS